MFDQRGQHIHGQQFNQGRRADFLRSPHQVPVALGQKVYIAFQDSSVGQEEAEVTTVGDDGHGGTEVVLTYKDGGRLTLCFCEPVK